MFISHRVPAKEYLKEGKNTLVLHFKSPWIESTKEMKANGGELAVCESPGMLEANVQGMVHLTGCTPGRLNTGGDGTG